MGVGSGWDNWRQCRLRVWCLVRGENAKVRGVIVGEVAVKLWGEGTSLGDESESWAGSQWLLLGS